MSEEYTNNGEFVSQQVVVGADVTYDEEHGVSNGVMTAKSGPAGGHTVSFDTRAGVLLTDNAAMPSPRPGNCVPRKFNPCKQQYVAASTASWSFDAAGRQVNGTGTTTKCLISTAPYPPPPTCSTSNTMRSTPARAYDVQNRLIGGGITTPTRVYSWGPNNHPQQIADPAVGQETLHWDGDGLLFTTNASGQVDDLKIEDFGDVYPLASAFSGLVLADRDPTGTAVTRHTIDGSTDTWNLMSPLLEPGSSQTAGNVPTGVFQTLDDFRQMPLIPINQPRTDGISDGMNTIQGVRTYEPSLNAWTTPDAYAGDINDPMSQKSYMWNGNNPISYEDPSGYCPQCIVGLLVVADLLVFTYLRNAPATIRWFKTSSKVRGAALAPGG
ncbi:MAG TPA: hypothetical protein VIJ12_08730 [Candidatus Baltobacteraceae bacterium]